MLTWGRAGVLILGLVGCGARADEPDARPGGDAAGPGDAACAPGEVSLGPLTLWLGDATLGGVGGGERAIPVMRTTSFPSLEDSNEMLGGDIQGLFGLTSVGAAHVRIDPARGSIFFGP